MNKVIGVLVIVFCLVLSGCGKKQEPSFELVTESEKEFRCVIEDEKTMDYIHSYKYFREGGEGVVYILNLPQSMPNSEKEQIADKMEVGSGDFVVIDYRYMKDANMQIRSSYRGESEDVRKCVIEVLLKYEENHPSKWERSYTSMENEWNFHNFSYYADYEVERSMHVDFNNRDEEVYIGPEELSE